MCANPQSLERYNRGMALVAAIGMLVIFALLGTAYVSYMSIEFEDAGTQLHRVRARNLAAGGIYAAIGEIQSRLDNGGTPADEYTFPLSTYRREQGGPGAYRQTVRVAVSDESARVNLNTAPLALIGALGLTPDAVAKLESMRAAGQRLASVDALRVNEVVDAAAYDALNTTNFTVSSEGGVNLNTASDEVLAAAFGISADEAGALAQKRPFTDWADVLQKVGREPSTFNLPVPAFAPREQPSGVAFTSRSFRLRSTVTMEMPGGNRRPVYAGVEAVVTFDDAGDYTIRSWTELRGADARDTTTAPTAPEAAGEPDEATN